MGIEVTKDETDKRNESVRKQREQIIRDNPGNADRQAAEMAHLQLDRTVIRNPDPKKRYRLVNRLKQDGVRPQVLEGSGWAITPEDDKARLVYGAKLDGGQIHGDLVLMETSAENYERARARERALYEQRLGNENESFRENANKALRDAGAKGGRDATFDESGDY